MSKVRNLFRKANAPEEQASRSSIDVKVTPADEPDYKLSSVSPEGHFMPPSPPEKQSFLSRFTNRSTNTTSSASASRRSLSGSMRSRAGVGLHANDEDEDDSGFTIPRASFDGYRRSFDIRPSMDESRPMTTQSTQTTTLGSPAPAAAALARAQGTKQRTDVQPPLVGDGFNYAAPQTASGRAEPAGDTFDDVDLNEAVVGQAGGGSGSDQLLQARAAPKKRFWQKSAAAATPVDESLAEHGAELHPYTPTQPAPAPAAAAASGPASTPGPATVVEPPK